MELNEIWNATDVRGAKAEIERLRGTYVDPTGDGLLARFDGPARAIRCAQGIAVHIGAQVAALAHPSEVLVSSTVKDLVAGSGVAFEGAGEHELKGVPDRWHPYQVLS